MKTALLAALLIAGQTADAITTCAALRSGRFRETNVLIRGGCTSVVAMKAVTITGFSAVYPRVRPTHPRVAAFLLWMPGVAGFAFAAINAHTMRTIR